MTSNFKSTLASYQINVKSRLIIVHTSGEWTLQTDMAYLSDLGEAMQSMRGNTWAVLVDMRGWLAPKSVSTSPLKSDVTLDRRNQKLECWIVDELSQGDALMPYFTQSGIVPKRFMDPQEAYSCLQNAGYISSLDTIQALRSLEPHSK
ncbi:hypothetical protein [Paraglaciecola polaris]|uniref:hypothetical protein n=1 Tax=Paraglaciecola polaris TaxID=222814 RepID=UPI0030EF3AB4|tara:strand:- start:16553 stop:16996 length:444 start_codon:yes stop_codon:yes gene_type:complete